MIRRVGRGLALVGWAGIFVVTVVARMTGHRSVLGLACCTCLLVGAILEWVGEPRR